MFQRKTCVVWNHVVFDDVASGTKSYLSCADRSTCRLWRCTNGSGTREIRNVYPPLQTGYVVWRYTTCVSMYSYRPCLPSAPPMPDLRRPAWKPCIASKWSRLT